MKKLAFLACASLALLIFAANAGAQSFDGASWIWGHWTTEPVRPAGEKCYFYYKFELDAIPTKATLAASCDNRFIGYVNGEKVASADNWMAPKRLDVSKLLKVGTNIFTFDGLNDSAPAALIFSCDIFNDGKLVKRIVSDSTTLTSKDTTDGWTAAASLPKTWLPAKVMTKYGGAPWGNLQFQAPPRIEPLEGFVVTPIADGFGSILSIALDAKDNAYIGTEGGGIYYLAKGSSNAELWCSEVTYAQGICWLNGIVYATGNGPKGAALYRIEKLATGEMSVISLGGFVGSGGEHGVHGIVAGPNDRLYITVGNHHQMAQQPGQDSPYKIHYEGHLLKHFEDPLGHAVGIKSPGGTIVSVDLEGKDWQLVAGGMRNAYDLAFDRNNSLFTYDSDMEWDVGLPWYRAVRLLHIVPGGEYGWRTGSLVWPDHYIDSLPPVLETGRGSPTGMAFYYGKQFPAKYYGSILACDWSLGTIFNFQLKKNERGDFVGTSEVLLRGNPLNVTDVVECQDGSVLFTLGGRGTYGGVFRLSYHGKSAPIAEPPAPIPNFIKWTNDEPDPRETYLKLAQLSSIRPRHFVLARWLETYDPGHYLIANGAIINIKDDELPQISTIVARWANANPYHPDVPKYIKNISEQIITFLAKYKDSPDPFVHALRALELLLLNPSAKAGGAISPEVKSLVLSLFPSKDRRANRELALLIAYFDIPDGVHKLLNALENEPSRQEQIHYAYCLRAMRTGFDSNNKARFIEWFRKAQTWAGGASFQGYIIYMMSEFDAFLSDAEKKLLRTPLVDAAPPPVPAVVSETGAAFVKDIDFTTQFVDRTRGNPRRSPADGALLYQSLCARCHTLGNQLGGQIGPDLTTASARFGTFDMLSAIVDPSRVISDQYPAYDVRKKIGAPVTGLKAAEDAHKIVIMQADGTRTEINKTDVDEIVKSEISLMPAGLLDALTYEQVGDLLAFIDARGAVEIPKAPAWKAIFNGKDFNGWTFDTNLWKIENGLAIGDANGLPESRFLAYETPFSNFIIEFDVMLLEGNSGLQFRALRAPKEYNLPHALLGYQADVGESYWGSLYEEGGRGMLAQPANEIWSSIIDRAGFNHYAVEANGNHIIIELNGVPTVDIHDNATPTGLFGFQLHGHGKTKVKIRNVRVKQL
ncbi:MAG: family 16 glycoside hydrolase [Planctomycetota bacterium]